MEYELKMSDSRDYAILDVRSDLTFHLSVKIADEIIRLGENAKVNKLLYDLSKVKNLEQVKPNFEIAFRKMPDPGNFKFKKTAFLVNVRDNSHEYFIGFLHARGFNLREFYDEKEAVNWLKKD